MKQSLFLVIFLLLSFEVTYSDTDVGGIINSNQTWIVANSPYNLISDVQIAYGASITIEPGVIINGNWFLIQIWGDFNAAGTEQNKIIFNDVNFRQGINVVQNQFFSALIQFSVINSGQLFNTSSGHIYGSLKIYDCKISNVANKMFLFFPKKDCFIERNIFYNCGQIRTSVQNNIKIYIRFNTFFQTGAPTSASTGYAVENISCYVGSDVIVKYNSFLNNDRVAVSLLPGYNNAKINAESNYWGTTDESVIQSMIYDKNDDLNCSGYIPYQPFLTEQHQITPLLGTKNDDTIFSFELSNYPNPFNPNTTISYSLEKDSEVSVNIYDISGKLITTFQNGYQNQGEHSITWNGMDGFRNKVGAGVYFYQVKTGNFVETKKMVLLK